MIYYIYFILLIVSVDAYTQDRTGTVEFSTSRDGHTATIIFSVGKFNPSTHIIVGMDPCEDYSEVKIDGRYPLGTDCTFPEYEIQSMRLNYDGVIIEIPKELYSDCYNPPFPPLDDYISNYFKMIIGNELNSVFVFMSGGDAAGHYQVIWVLRPDGKHSRLTQACSDCSFIDMTGFVDE
jgi:hypothetical protein